MKKICIKLIKSYQKKTENKAHKCRFYPSCSNYGLIAYERFNFFTASFLTLFRILRCNPLSKGGYNPVPEKKSKLIKINNNVYILEYKENTDRPNIGYILDNNIGYMIDGCNSKKHVKYFFKKLKKEKLPLPKYTIITHHHWDHTFGLNSLNSTTIGLLETNDILLIHKEKIEKYGINCLFEQNEIPLFCKDHIKLEYKWQKINIKPLDITISSDYKLNNINLLKFPSFHSNDTLIALDSINKVLFLGDSLCGKTDKYDFIDDINTIYEQIKYLEKLDFNIAVESHNNPSSKDDIILKLKKKTEKNSSSI